MTAQAGCLQVWRQSRQRQRADSDPRTSPSACLCCLFPEPIAFFFSFVQVKDQPNLTWTADPTKLYSLFFVDPDAPTRSDPKNGQWFHWYPTCSVQR